ncbi:MAG: hypothetical protein GYA24_21950 [Candidatus Lokiarchaeota archaeon]|nr:hypothetical protein [Candidatus Lokiarchaeota archaeon]
MRIHKHKVTITCPWCRAGSSMTFRDERGDYCLACKLHVRAGEWMLAPYSRLAGDPRSIN